MLLLGIYGPVRRIRMNFSPEIRPGDKFSFKRHTIDDDIHFLIGHLSSSGLNNALSTISLLMTV